MSKYKKIECKDCGFFCPAEVGEILPDSDGDCYRYPKPEMTLGMYWCGEAVPKEDFE